MTLTLAPRTRTRKIRSSDPIAVRVIKRDMVDAHLADVLHQRDSLALVQKIHRARILNKRDGWTPARSGGLVIFGLAGEPWRTSMRATSYGVVITRTRSRFRTVLVNARSVDAAYRHAARMMDRQYHVLGPSVIARPSRTA